LSLMAKPMISLIVAMDANRLIGAGNALPWHLPNDMKRFKAITMGKPVVMGRKTYESIPPRFRPLTGRHNIVVTRNRAYQAAGCPVVHSAAEALAVAGPVEEVIIGGGAQLYRLFLPQADRLYLTLIDAEFEGDSYFPRLEFDQWREISRETYPADEGNPHGYHFVILER
jgi:dihydrofolate reductase